MRRYTAILLFILTFASCRPLRIPSPITQVTVRKDTLIRESGETVVDYLPADSAHLVGELAVDQLGNVTLSNILEYSPGQNVTPDIRIRDNYVYIDCRVDSAEIYRRYSRLYFQQVDSIRQVSFIPAPGVDNTRSRGTGFFHRALHTAGYLFLAQLLILAGYFIFKLRKIVSIF